MSLLIPLLGFLFEVYPRIVNKKFGVDIWTHLLYLNEYYKQKKIPDKIKNGFIIEGIYDYPPIFILILSRFPFKLVKKYEYLFSPVFDLIYMILIFYFSYIFSGSLVFSMFVQLLYILTPIIILENSNATPRSLGYTLFGIVFLSLIIFEISGIIYFLIPSLLGSLIFLSHRFTTQGYLFLSIVFSLIFLNTIYLGSFLFSFILAMVISRGFYKKVFEGHIGNLKFWHKNINYRFAHQVKGNMRYARKKDIILNLYTQFLKFPPFVLLITNIWSFVAIISILIINFDPFLIRIYSWVIVTWLLALLTMWVKPLRVLGEGQRYLELSAFPAALLSVLLLFNIINSPYFIFAFFYLIFGVSSLITIVVIQRKAIIKDKMRTITDSQAKMYAYLKKMKRKPRLLCIPHQITTSTIYHTGCKVLVNADYKNIIKLSNIYPYIRLPIKRIFEKYSLDMLLLNTEYSSIESLNIKNAKIVKRYDNYVLIKFKA